MVIEVNVPILFVYFAIFSLKFLTSSISSYSFCFTAFPLHLFLVLAGMGAKLVFLHPTKVEWAVPIAEDWIISDTADPESCLAVCHISGS